MIERYADLRTELPAPRCVCSKNSKPNRPGANEQKIARTCLPRCRSSVLVGGAQSRYAPVNTMPKPAKRHPLLIAKSASHVRSMPPPVGVGSAYKPGSCEMQAMMAGTCRYATWTSASAQIQVAVENPRRRQVSSASSHVHRSRRPSKIVPSNTSTRRYGLRHAHWRSLHRSLELSERTASRRSSAI